MFKTDLLSNALHLLPNLQSQADGKGCTGVAGHTSRRGRLISKRLFLTTVILIWSGWMSGVARADNNSFWYTVGKPVSNLQSDVGSLPTQVLPWDYGGHEFIWKKRWVVNNRYQRGVYYCEVVADVNRNGIITAESDVETGGYLASVACSKGRNY